MLTVKQAAQALGIWAATMYALIADGRLAAHRFGLGRGTIRIEEEVLRIFKAGARVEPKRPTLTLKHLTLND